MSTEKETNPIIIYCRMYQSKPYGAVKSRELILKIAESQNSNLDVYDFLLKEVSP